MKKLSILIFSFLFVNSLSAQTVDSIIDIRDNQVYKVVKIGTQWWMQENLNIGTQINGNQDESNNGIIEKYCYGDNLNSCNIYGGLYRWDEMMDYNPSDNANPGTTRGVCPVGWRLPSDSEWKELEMFLGMSQAEADNLNQRGTVEGSKMKEVGITHWESPNIGANNESGFTALPGGYNWGYPYFYLMGYYASFWSSTEFYSDVAWGRTLTNSISKVIRSSYYKDSGFSVRCLRDSSEFGYLTISDDNFNPVPDLKFYGYKNLNEIIIINSGKLITINISSIHTGNSAFSLNETSSTLSPGDSIHLNVVFNPPIKGKNYFDTLNITCDDPNRPMIYIPLEGREPITDSIVDIRDNQIYKVVKIGPQWWMQENLNIGIRINSSTEDTDNGIIEKYCYGDNLNNCDIYGGLYRWDEMMDYSKSDIINPEANQGICPVGWHLLNDDAWTEMVNYLGGEDIAGGKLKETGTTHWTWPNIGATDESGFTALPGGWQEGENYVNLGRNALFWSSYDDPWGTTGWNLPYSGKEIWREDHGKGAGVSVRCLRDSIQYSYLTISDNNFKTVSDLNFYSYQNSKEIILINSATGKTINISSIHTGTSIFNPGLSSSNLLPGDSIHLNIAFNPPLKGANYYDTLNIISNDPYKQLVVIPLEGYEPETDSIIDIRDNQIYKVVKIGPQWWMQENLNIGKRINGSQDAADNGIIEKYCYNNNNSMCNIYGGLYQGNEMMDYNPLDDGNQGKPRGICPIGWHLPGSEWTELLNFLGGASQAGGMMKETGTSHWIIPNGDASNKSGFTALPGGYRNWDGNYDHLGIFAYYWPSSGLYNDEAIYIRLNNNNSGVEQYGISKKLGFSVRCLRDSSRFSLLTISDLNFNQVSDLTFYDDNVSKEITLINSGAEKTIIISSISTKNAEFELNYASAVLTSGDSIHLTITFNPPDKNIYPDTLFIISNDPYSPLITISLNGTFPPEITFTDSSNISCFGNSDGSATVTPSLGTPPYVYFWDDPVHTTDSIVHGLLADKYYHVNVTDAMGWTVTDSIKLSQPDSFRVQSDHSDIICPGTNDGSINLSPSGGTLPYTYSWSNGAETQNISDVSAGSYSVTVTDNNGCEYSENIIINSSVPYENEKICIVTVDLLSGKNIIVWEKTPDVGIKTYNIYRESTIGQYEYIGSKNVGDLSIFRDETADPESRSYLYKITITDTCGNNSEIESARYHRPSFLQYVSSVGGINLSWTDYKIEGIDNIGDYLNSYAIYRGTDATGLTEYQVVGSINNFTDTDPDALVRKYYYRVAGVLKNPCYPTASSGKKDEPGPYSFSLSNMEDNRILMPGTNDIKGTGLSIYPNPFIEQTILAFNNPDRYNYTLYIMDLSGKVCRMVNNINTSRYVIEKGDLQEGFYMIELRGPNLYRERIIVE